MATGSKIKNNLVIQGDVTASAFSGDGSALTGIQHTDISALNTFTGSIQSEVDSLTSSTSSYATTSSVDTLTAATASYATTSSVDTLTAATSSYLTSIPSTYFNSSLLETQNITKNFSFSSNLNITTITSSVEGAIIDYRLTSLDSGSRVGTFMYAHDGTDLNYVDTSVEGTGIGSNPILSATLTGSIVSIDIENAAGFNFSGFAKKFSKLENAVIVADPNTNYLFDSYPNATLAYSLRQLNQPYTGNALRVREDGSNTETDIGFDINGELDVASIISHCGSNNGYVTTWYDQSGNTNNATQSLANDQPLIYNGSSINETNGKPSLSFSGGRILLINNPVTTATNFLLSAVNTAQANQFPWGGSDSFLFYASTSTTRFRGLSSDLNYVRTVPTAGTQEHYVVDLSSGTATFRVNAITGVTGARYADATLGTLGDGQGNTTGRHTGTIQEFIIWNSNQLQARSGIETNTNNYYSIYDTGLLVDYPGATAAYSVRQLTTVYTGDAMDIRRASDNTEQTIGFDSNGNLDTESILTFASTGSAFVTKWYDQSGNNNHAFQLTQGEQPKILDSGSIITASTSLSPSIQFGKPGWPPSTTLDLTNAIDWYAGTGLTFFIVNRANVDTQYNRLIGNSGGNNVYANQGSDNTIAVRANNTIYSYNITSSIGINNNDLLQVLTYSSASKSGSVYINDFNIEILTGSEEQFNPNTFFSINRIGEGQGNQQNNYYGYMSELIFYTSSLDINSIRNDINTHYNIY